MCRTEHSALECSDVFGALSFHAAFRAVRQSDVNYTQEFSQSTRLKNRFIMIDSVDMPDICRPVTDFAGNSDVNMKLGKYLWVR
jgi:hypothetical protein